MWRNEENCTTYTLTDDSDSDEDNEKIKIQYQVNVFKDIYTVIYLSNELVYVMRLVVSISFKNLSNIPPIVYLIYMKVIILNDRKMIFW